MKKLLMVLAAILLLTIPASAHVVAGETDANLSIADDNTFGFTKFPEQNSWLYLNLRITDENGTALKNAHIHLKVFDERGAIIGDYSDSEKEKCYSDGECETIIEMIISDHNGNINYAIPINACSAIKEDFCYNIDQRYKLQLSGKGLQHEEYFTVKIAKMEHIKQGFGDFLRTIIENMANIYIGVLLIICAIFVWWMLAKAYKRARG